jgi:hypothetical protein
MMKLSQKEQLGEIHIGFGTKNGRTLVHGIELHRNKEHVATTYWSNVDPTNTVEIAICAERLTDLRPVEEVRQWLTAEKKNSERPTVDHQPGNDWITIGFNAQELNQFLQRVRAFRRTMGSRIAPALPPSEISSLEQQLEAPMVPIIHLLPDAPLSHAKVGALKKGKIYIANFGTQNYLWQECLADNIIATFELMEMLKFFTSDDREGYIERIMKVGKTASGSSVPRSLASRWFTIGKNFEQTDGDIWIHKEGNYLWWTVSLPSALRVREAPANHRRAVEGEVFYELIKDVMPWSNKNLHGNRLLWNQLHAKAKRFLFTEGTLQQPNPDNASYTRALIAGDDLEQWHKSASWKATARGAAHAHVTLANSRQKSVTSMALTAIHTTTYSDGREIISTGKIKNFLFDSSYELETYIFELLELQNDECAISGLPLQFLGEHDNSDFLCSLDRIDSDGHYERGNLQIVCRFINGWKGARMDKQFRFLLKAVCEHNNVNLG